MILCSNPLAQYLAQKDEIDAAIRRVLESGWYILGKETSAFESEFAAYLGVEEAVGVGSGTEALHLALKACDIGPGDEVVTVSHTAVATVAAIELAGATPVLVDIEPQCCTLDPQRLAEAITPRTRAVIPVHLYGQPADLGAICDLARRRGIRLIEDCAQALGAEYDGKRVGCFGDIGCFSFYPTKNLGALGDGGAVVSSDAALAGRLRGLREYGWSERYVSSAPGLNSRLDELQSALLRVKLRTLDRSNAARDKLARRYDEALAGLELGLPQRRPGSTHAFHLYVVRTPRREHLLSHLRENGVGALVHYPVPVHLQPAYSGRVPCSGPMTQSERAAREVLSLPLYPELAQADQNRVIAAVRGFFGSAG